MNARCGPAFRRVLTASIGLSVSIGCGGRTLPGFDTGAGGAQAGGFVEPDMTTVRRPPSEIAPTADCPRGVPNSGDPLGCEYNTRGPDDPLPGTLSLMKLRVTGPDGVAAYCWRPHCTIEPGKALHATATSDPPRTVSVQFGDEPGANNPWTLQMKLDRSEDGSYTSDGNSSSCFPWGIGPASEPARGGAYPPVSRLWSCKLRRADGNDFTADGCVSCTGWDAN